MLRALCLGIGLLLGATASSDAAERRVALVIGNSAYQHAPDLANPIRDAEGVTARLEELGFEVIAGHNLTFNAMRRTIREFARRLDGAAISLLYYAGHGLQVNGENYIIPVDAELKKDIDLSFEALSMQFVLNVMEGQTHTNLVFLDACRDNPLAHSLARSMGTRSGLVGRGLARIEAGVGTLVSYATQPGNVALDGEGANSPFTKALLDHLGTPGEDIALTLRKVRTDVLAATNGRQVPWENSSLTGEVILKALEAVKESVDEASEQIREGRDADVEIAYWNSIKDTERPEFFESYLKEFPDGRFAALARLNLSLLAKPDETEKPKGSDKATAAPPEPVPVSPAEAAEIALGLSRSAYLEVQRQLNISGYPVGSEDGLFGPKSRRGLSAFQRATDLEPTGYLTEESLRRLEAAATQSAAITVQSASATEAPPKQLAVAKPDVSKAPYDGVWTGARTCKRFAEDPPDVDMSRPRQRTVVIENGAGVFKTDARSREAVRAAKNNYTEIRFTVSSDGRASGRGVNDCCFHNGRLLESRVNEIVLTGSVGEDGVLRLAGVHGPRRCEWTLSLN